MSMDEMLMNELYGSEEVQQEEQIKQAQVELVEAVASEAGVDLNELDDDELAKFAHYVLSDEDEETKRANLIIPGDVGMIGAYKGRERMRRAGMSEDQMDDVQSVLGGGARSIGKGIKYGLGGGVAGGLGGAAVGGLIAGRPGALLGGTALGGLGAGTGLYYGAYRGHKDEVDTGRAAAEAFKRSREGRKKTAALQEADLMGRQMAHSYVEEINNISQGETMYDDTFTKVASALDDVAEAWSMEKEASIKAKAGKMYRKGKDVVMGGYRGQHGSLKKMVGYAPTRARETQYGQRALRAGLTLGAGTGAIYGAKKGIDKIRGKGQQKEASYADLMVRELEKSASYEVFSNFDDVDTAIEKRAHLLADAGYEALAAIEICGPAEFAKEAEFRAAEILVANGVHPETFDDIEPEEVKIASFPGVEYAADEHEAAALEEYNEMLDAAALHIIDNLVD